MKFIFFEKRERYLSIKSNINETVMQNSAFTIPYSNDTENGQL
ncbi:hypothetical protein XCR1_4300006 [Xenorhabdus cabanillasii JM26]|uniref:Uncharacterized protein n=1 Tax=Xenorhabdus cabanillasii JM26 TaxID=1427517 RepID=W1J7C4_9GAMM|nr:hypothetical protein XCR1_4300006 [Xenorhabdus cabanillasii JM26]